MKNEFFATNLKKRRKLLKLTQKDLSLLCVPPISASEISLLEKGKVSPNLKRVIQLKIALECSYESLIDDHEEIKKIRNTKMHTELVNIAEKWLYKKDCWFVLKEFPSSIREIPDAIGFGEKYSILVECKATEVSFKCDAKKPFRINPELGVGHHRYYMCPEGVIEIKDLPDGWGLIYVKFEKATVICGNDDNNFWDVPIFKVNKDNEQKMIRTALQKTIHRL